MLRVTRDQHEKTWRPTFSYLHNTPHNTPYPKKPTRIHWLLYDKLRENPNSAIGKEFLNLPVFGLTAGLPACLP